MVANGRRHQQAMDHRTVAPCTPNASRRRVRPVDGGCLSELEHLDQVSADQHASALLLWRLVRQRTHATRQPARRLQMALLRIVHPARWPCSFIE
jgi:hypothetical protein